MENKNKPIQWHQALISGLKIELSEYQDVLSIDEEFTLNSGPRRIDGLITKATGSPPIRSPIGVFFRQYNLIDYKSPSESMNIKNFHKVLSYVYSLPEHFHSDEILSKTTVTLVSHRFPVKLVRYIREKILRQDTSPLKKIIPGLYHVNTDRIYPFPIQLVLLPQLPPEEYLWLSCLGNRSLKNVPLDILRKDYAKHMEDPVYQTIMNTIIRANFMKKEDADIMCEALYELFADELLKRETDGRRAGEEYGIKLGEERGVKLGEKRGIERGENRISSLILRLISDNRSAEIERMASDAGFRASLMEQYNLN